MRREEFEVVAQARYALASQIKTSSLLIENIRGRLVEEDNQSINRINSEPEAIKETLAMILQDAQEKGKTPSRVKLAVLTIKRFRTIPLVEQAASYMGKEPLVLVAAFDYSMGIVQVLEPFMTAEQYKEGNFVQKAEKFVEGADLNSDKFASTRAAAMARLMALKQRIEQAREFARLMEQDETGYSLLAETTRRLTEHGALHPLIASLVSSGAMAGNRLYRTIYPHTEGLVT